MAGAAEQFAGGVAVVCGAGRLAFAGGAGLGDLLIEDAVALLAHVEMIVTVEDGGDMVSDEQLVDGHGPAGAMQGEAGRVVKVLAAPLEEGGGFDAASGVLVEAADEMVDEDELVACVRAG